MRIRPTTGRIRNPRDKTIKLSIFLWTDYNGESLIHQAWNKGVVVLRANKSHGIKPRHRMFNSPDALLPKLQELLDDQGIMLWERNPRTGRATQARMYP